MRTSILLSTLVGSIATAAEMSTISVWGLEIVRRFDQTMVGEILSEMPSATVVAYSCPDEIGCGTATITNGPSTFDATLTTSDIPGQAAATETEIIHCDIAGASSADCMQSFVTVTNGATATALVTKNVETDFAQMPIVVPKTGGSGGSAYSTTTAAPSSTPKTTGSTTSIPVYSTAPPSSFTSSVYGGNGTATMSMPSGTSAAPSSSTSAPPGNAAPVNGAGLISAVGAALGVAAFAL